EEFDQREARATGPGVGGERPSHRKVSGGGRKAVSHRPRDRPERPLPGPGAGDLTGVKRFLAASENRGRPVPLPPPDDEQPATAGARTKTPARGLRIILGMHGTHIAPLRSAIRASPDLSEPTRSVGPSRALDAGT